MKPVAPDVPLAVWKILYLSAGKVHSRRPWEHFDDTHLIGVRDPVTGEVGYGCFMGSGGTLFGFCLYGGAEGFDFYRRLMEGHFEPESFDFIYLQRCLKLEFGAKADLEPEDLSVIKALGLSFRGETDWPQFRSLSPGDVPWFLESKEAAFLTFALDAAIHHLDLFMKREVQSSVRQGEVLVYSRGEQGFLSAWEPWPIYRPEPAPPLALDYTRARAALAKATKPDSPWEAAVSFTPQSISDGGKPSFVKVALVCQKSSGFVFNMAADRAPRTDADLLADVIVGSLEKHGFRPSTIFLSDAVTLASLSPLSKALEIPFDLSPKLPAVKMAMDEMLRAMDSGRFRA
ncbi:MAG: hypothetical protein IPN19_15220 [Elusimicrobia bacterium]|nr:hypothetical protein [Elusimicrobiota bacterium]